MFRACIPGLRILPQAMNKLQGERAVVNKKYDMSLPLLSRAENEGLKGGMRDNMKDNVLIMKNMKDMKKENFSL